VGAAEAVSGSGRLLHVTFDDAYRNVKTVLPLLERLGVQATVFACSGFAPSGAPLLIPELEERAIGYEAELTTMNWDALRDAAERGFEIGSHTISHPHLPRLADAELDRELRESRDRIADTLGRPCRLLAYPFGENDGRVRAAARAAGYVAAFALRAPHDAPLDPYGVERVDIYRGDGPVRFALKTSSVHRPLIHLADRVRGPRARVSP
jgi:peptidoglycan/xylan/chitin deacetylase (PgdA/CDA1 family)